MGAGGKGHQLPASGQRPARGRTVGGQERRKGAETGHSPFAVHTRQPAVCDQDTADHHRSGGGRSSDRRGIGVLRLRQKNLAQFETKEAQFQQRVAQQNASESQKQRALPSKTRRRQSGRRVSPDWKRPQPNEMHENRMQENWPRSLPRVSAMTRKKAFF